MGECRVAIGLRLLRCKSKNIPPPAQFVASKKRFGLEFSPKIKWLSFTTFFSQPEIRGWPERPASHQGCFGFISVFAFTARRRVFCSVSPLPLSFLSGVPRRGGGARRARGLKLARAEEGLQARAPIGPVSRALEFRPPRFGYLFMVVVSVYFVGYTGAHVLWFPLLYAAVSYLEEKKRETFLLENAHMFRKPKLSR